MSVKIRLARGGAKKVPYYRIVVANNTAPRDGDFLERIGTYNPLLKKDDKNRVTLVKDRVDYWISKGAKPTDRVAKFLSEAGIKLPAHITKKIDLLKKVYDAKAKVRAEEEKKKAKEKAAEEAAAAKEAEEAAKAEAESKAAEAPAEEVKVEEAPVEEAKAEESAPEAAEAPADEKPAEEPKAEEAPAEEEKKEE